jgi:hypothetical protein
LTAALPSPIAAERQALVAGMLAAKQAVLAPLG